MDYDVIVIDNLWRGKIENLYENGKSIIDINKNFFNIDLAETYNIGKVKEIVNNCEFVIHLADIVAGIGYVFNKQHEIFTINNAINTNLFNATIGSNIKKLNNHKKDNPDKCTKNSKSN